MELKGKTVLFLGDSITEGAGASSPEQGYVSVFQRLSGAHTVNYGIGGTRIAKQKSPSRCDVWDRDFIGRVDEMQPEADVVVVFGGTNDFGHGDAELGSFSSGSEDTFYGALHTLCQKLIGKYPKAEIVFLTPLHRISEDSTVSEIGLQTCPLSSYVTAIQEIAGYYALPVLDLFRTSGLQPKVDKIRELYMPDGLHPSDAGAAKIAQKLYNFLKAI